MGAGIHEAKISELERDGRLLARSSTTEQVALILRERITDGLFPPGTRLSEESIGAALRVSRNTLREAFRLLAHERLVEHRLNRGVFVRQLSPEDVVALFRMRRIVECAALRELAAAPEKAIHAVRKAVENAEAAAEAGRWNEVGTASMQFHEAIVGLAGSPHLKEFMHHVLAELRLAVGVASYQRRLHEPQLARKRVLLDLIEARDAQTAEQTMAEYLSDAREELLRVCTEAAEAVD
ncbi:GntR family transcriptional regulator [Kitasatospora sp. NPDC059088]|uniref:GntR family transcriptional regulator n=1 Tax=Kitasatospora sp. NPDC059088 TaxID=3346722 RepID=UPI0036B51726